jgi:hypothetical protein
MNRDFLKKPRQQPTFAEPIEQLSSVILRLTAVFGMGTGRSTNVSHQEIKSYSVMLRITSTNAEIYKYQT